MRCPTSRVHVLVLLALAVTTSCMDADGGFADAPIGTADGGDSGAGDPPDTQLTVTPAELSNQPLARFEFASVPGGLGLVCQVDDAAAVPCTSPLDVPVTDGAHTFAVAAVDASAVADPTPATFAWTVDLTPPQTSIVVAPPLLDNSVAVSFEFGATEDGSFTCALDGGAPVACTSPHAVDGLTDGDHAFEVTATDLAGNADPTPAVHAWTVDTSAPDTTIDTGPTGAVSAVEATFTFSTPDAATGATFECALDGAAFTACTSPATYASLAEGPHTFQVRVLDATGNVDPTPATRTWTVDTVAPTVAITGGPTGVTSDVAPSFTFTTAGAPTSTACRIDTGAYAPCTSPFAAATLADGAHTFEVQVIDAAGNSATATRTFTVDTMGPTVTITGGPSGDTNDSTPSFTFTTAGAPTSTQCRIDAAAYANCTSPYVAAALADGAHTFSVQVTDAAGNTGSASRAFTVDTVGPTVTITGGPSGDTNDTTPTFTFTTGGAPTSTQCRIDAAAPIDCTASYTPAALGGGAHTFHVTVTDAAGNSASASRAFTVDTVGPTVTITGGPSGDTNDTTPSFTFTTGGAPTSTQCRIDAAAYANCTSPYVAAALADGAHTFSVQVTDAAGNTGSASRAFTVDTVGPTVTITGGPSGATNVATPSFTFTTGGAPISTQCRIDAAAYANCTSPYVAAALADGAHTFSVQVTDAAGNSASASRAFTVDTVAPTVTNTGGPSGATNDTTPSFTFTTGGAPTSTQCRIDAAAYANCASPYVAAALADGAHTFSVQVTDAAGNSASASRAFTVDTVAPTVTITGGPSGATNVATPSFTFTTGGAPTSTQCRIDAAAYANCTSPYVAAALADGAHTFSVQVTDAAGNSASASRAFTVDTVAPTVTITGGPSGATNVATPSFTFTTGGAPTSTQCRIDAAAYANCTSPYVAAALADGAHTFSVQVTDAAGNTGSASRAFTVDTVAPTVTITGGPSGATNVATPSFTFTTGGAPTSTQCRIDAAAYTNCTSPYVAAALADGAHTFSVQVTDAAGNSASASRAFTVDTVAPTVTITGGPSGATNDTTPTFTFTTGGAPTSTDCRVDAGGYAACASPFTTAALADGAHTVTVRVTDAAGNSASASRAFTVDTVAPTVTITGGPSGATNVATPSFTFTTGGAPTSTQCRIDAAAYANCASPYVAAALADGAHTFSVQVTDAAGNSASASRAFTVDTVAPTVTITGGPSGATNVATPSFTFTTGGAPTSTQCRIDAAAYTNCTSPYVAAALADGAHTFSVQVTDAAGNNATASQAFTVDTVAPTVTITAGPSGATNDTTPTFTFTTGGAPTTTQCRIDSAALVNCAATYTPAALSNAAHTFYVTVTDAAGNSATASRAFTVDTVAPTVTITGGPTGATNDTTPTFTFTTGGAPTTTQCRIDSAALVNCAATYTPAALSNAAHTFYVTVTDAAGNSATASRAFTVDTVAPTVTITGGPTGATNDTTPTFTFTTGGAPTTTRCRIDSAALVNCASSYTPAALANGAHTFYVTVTDAAGNSATASRNFTVDTVAPGLTITSGPANNAFMVNQSSVSYGFSTSGASGTRCRLYITGQTVPAYSTCTSPVTYSIGFASYTFQVQAFDAAGNTATISRTFQNQYLGLH